jgi:hypothetical protein
MEIAFLGAGKVGIVAEEYARESITFLEGPLSSRISARR